MSLCLSTLEPAVLAPSTPCLFRWAHRSFPCFLSLPQLSSSRVQNEKYKSSLFGRCPRFLCGTQPVLPIGLADHPRVSTVNVFCPRCRDVFVPRSTRHAAMDGAYFGTTFAHLFLLTHPEAIPPAVEQSYVPRIYGFKINADSTYYTAARRRENEERERRAGRGAGGGGGERGEGRAPLSSTAIMRRVRQMVRDGRDGRQGR